MKKVFILLTFCGFLTSLFATNTCDSLENALVKTKNSEEELEILIRLISCFKTTNINKSMGYAYKAIDVAKKIEDPVLCGKTDVIMADLMYQNGTYATAINYYTYAIESYNKLGNYKMMCELYIKIANAYQLGEFQNNWSIETMTKAVDCAKKSGNAEILAKALLSFGQLYQIQGKFKEANFYYSEVIGFEISKETIRYIAIALSNMSAIAISEKDYDKALKMADSSLYLCIRDSYDEFVILNYGYKAEVCDSLRLLDEAEYYYWKCIDLCKANNDVNTLAKYVYNFGRHYLLYNKNKEAINWFNRVADSAIKLGIYDYAYKSLAQLATLYAGFEDYKKAYNAFNLYEKYHDTVFYIWQSKKIEQHRQSYLLSLSIKELNLAKKEIIAIKQTERYKLTGVLFISSILFLITITTIFLWRINVLRQRQKEKIIQQQNELADTKNNMMELQLKNNRDSLVNLAFHLRSYTEFIQNLKDDLKNITNLPQDQQKIKIKEITLNLQHNIQLHQNMEELENKVNEIYKDFFDRLDEKYPDLTKSDRRLCAMLRMNMSTKEIAVLTSTSVRAVETGRYRLRKKFDLSINENIVDFIQNF